MTLTQKYNQVKSAVITACPEVMELSFGCRVEYEDRQFLYITDGMAGMYTIWSKESSAIHKSPNDIKILGHPIGIAYVLRAIEKEKSYNTFDVVDGNFQIWDEATYDDDKPVFIWNLSQDTLDWHLANKPEVVEFLYNILK